MSPVHIQGNHQNNDAAKGQFFSKTHRHRSVSIKIINLAIASYC